MTDRQRDTERDKQAQTQRNRDIKTETDRDKYTKKTDRHSSIHSERQKTQMQIERHTGRQNIER